MSAQLSAKSKIEETYKQIGQARYGKLWDIKNNDLPVDRIKSILNQIFVGELGYGSQSTFQALPQA